MAFRVGKGNTFPDILSGGHCAEGHIRGKGRKIGGTRQFAHSINILLQQKAGMGHFGAHNVIPVPYMSIHNKILSVHICEGD